MKQKFLKFISRNLAALYWGYLKKEIDAEVKSQAVMDQVIQIVKMNQVKDNKRKNLTPSLNHDMEKYKKIVTEVKKKRKEGEAHSDDSDDGKDTSDEEESNVPVYKGKPNYLFSKFDALLKLRKDKIVRKALAKEEFTIK